MQITTTLVKHTPKSVQGKNGLFTIHEFVDANGLEFSTTKTPIANELYSKLNQPVGLEYEEKPNGNWTNRYISKVLAQLPMAGSSPAGPAAPTIAPTTPTTTSQAPAAQQPMITQDETQILIMFQSFSNGVAFPIAEQLAETVTVENLASITKALIVEAMKFSKDAAAAVAAGGASSPGTGGGDAGAGPESAPAQTQTDDDIPF